MNKSINPIEFPKSTMISVNNIELEVFEAGKENKGKPILLCHGFPENAYSWRFQIPELVKAGYHVCRLPLLRTPLISINNYYLGQI
ncbi:alpha/beta fold hydrolase [Cellulophaga baltica]|uniref:alpha/beta fold hydrolase n=1 Tax=Cellulophaga baltica TaxID=76594 RepID=UPI00352D24E6